MTASRSYFETCPLWVYVFWAFAIGVLSCWPIAVTGAVFVFFDTDTYLTNGAAIQGVLSGMLDAGAASGGDGAGAATAEVVADRGRTIRSIVYSAYAYFGALTPFGLVGPMVVQSAMVTAVGLLLVPVQALRQPVWVAVALGVLLVLTPWPFYASLFMPDLLTAAVILGAMVLAKGTNRRGYWVVGLMMGFAAASHYGNVPLVLALVGCMALWMLVRGRLSWARAALLALPLVAAAGVNVLGGMVAFGETSVAPRRLPILLARSLEDGPARWHLENKCDVYKYEICTALESIPDNVGAALWKDGGLAKIASVEVLDRIRDEEAILLWRAFLEYPGAQSWSLIGNAALQMGRFGLSDVYGGEITLKDNGRYVVTQDQHQYRSTFDALEWLHIVVVLLALAVVIEAMARRRVAMTPVVVIMLLGFVFNAGIFGGLSAPVDRYQGRIIWILPMLAALILLSRKTDDGPG